MNPAHDPRPGRLLIEVRTAAGLTQAEVARLAAVPQSMVSAYESGGRQPSVPVLSRLLEAMGHELSLLAVPLPVELAGLRGPVGRRVLRHRHRLIELAARRGLRDLRVFGRVARGEDRQGERVELLVDLPPGDDGTARIRLLLASAELSEVLDAPVVLVTERELSPAQRVAIEPDLVTL